jgi:hypothetical protein
LEYGGEEPENRLKSRKPTYCGIRFLALETALRSGAHIELYGFFVWEFDEPIPVCSLIVDIKGGSI